MAAAKLFVIGDSISMHYGPYLKKNLEGRFVYGRKGEGKDFGNINDVSEVNGGDSLCVLEYLSKIIDSGFSTDYLMLNCGLHDIKTDPKTGKVQVGLDDYVSNLNDIFKLAADNSIKLIWARITPVDDNQHNKPGMSFFRYRKDVAAYNKAADEIFKAAGVDSIDLHSFTHNLDEPLFCDHIHFNEPVRKLQAAFIAGYLFSLS